MLKFRGRVRTGEVDDRALAWFLANEALFEIQTMGRRFFEAAATESPGEVVANMRSTAKFAGELMAVSRASSWRPSRSGPGTTSMREQAMAERPMSYRWDICGPERQAWILRHLDRAGYRWTPPPPLPTSGADAPMLSRCQQILAMARWPVRTPPGCRPLPRRARVLKALDHEALFALYQEAGRLRLGLGKPSPWLNAHLDPGAVHYLYPDPAAYYWPDPAGGRPWWECHLLVRMVDGEQVSGMLAVMPETFTALPSTVPRLRQRRLVLLARLTRRDIGLWGQDHKQDCGPASCGFRPPEDSASMR